MNIYGPIFIVRKHSGDYEDYRMENICAFKTQECANHFKIKIEFCFKKLYSFYEEKKQEIYDKHGRDLMLFPDDVFNKYYVYSNKSNNYHGNTFDIEEVQIRRFK